MNWLKRLWNWFITPSEDACCAETPDTKNAEERDVQKIVYDLCRAAGIPHRDIAKNKITETFEQWYTGATDENEIKAAMDEFKEEHPALKPKLQRVQ